MARPNFHHLDSSCDTKLLELGSRLNVAIAEENSLYAESQRTYDDLDTKDPKRALKFRHASKTDRQILRLLGEHDWPKSANFNPGDIDNLRQLAEHGRLAIEVAGRAVERRIKKLIAASDAYGALTNQPHILSLERRCEEAGKRTLEIVGLIESLPARTLEGLIVKAKAVRWCRTGDLDFEDLEPAATDTRICHSIMKDLAAMGA